MDVFRRYIPKAEWAAEKEQGKEEPPEKS